MQVDLYLWGIPYITFPLCQAKRENENPGLGEHLLLYGCVLERRQNIGTMIYHRWPSYITPHIRCTFTSKMH